MSKRKLKHITLIAFLVFVACSSSPGGSYEKAEYKKIGAMSMTNRCYVGRFSLSLPETMFRDAQSPTVRAIVIDDFLWPKGDKLQVKELEWKKHLSELARMRKPEGVEAVIIDQVDLSSSDRWIKGVFYYGNQESDEGFWDVLVDAGDVGVWFKYDGRLDAKQLMLKLVLDVATHYQSFREHQIEEHPPGPLYCTRYGRINIPYKDQESTYARFREAAQDLQLEIEMNDTPVDEPKEEGLLARTAAAIATGFAAGVDIKKIRSRDRVVAGIKGEEQVVRMKDSDGVQFDFTWRSPGKKDSGEYPKILISMESPDGKIDGKLKVWDAILDSVRPLYKPSP